MVGEQPGALRVVKVRKVVICEELTGTLGSTIDDGFHRKDGYGGYAEYPN